MIQNLFHANFSSIHLQHLKINLNEVIKDKTDLINSKLRQERHLKLPELCKLVKKVQFYPGFCLEDS